MVMLAIRIPGVRLKKARQLLGWSLQEAAVRSQVNWLTLRRYEAAGEYLPPGTIAAVNRLVEAYEDAGVRFDTDGTHLERAAPIINSAILNEGTAA
jgi:hypothetical protein